MFAVEANKNLCVDLDGTLIRSDTLLESLLILLKKKTWKLIFIPYWLIHGKAYFKHKISQEVDLDPSLLPYHKEFLDYLRKEHTKGRKLILATAANERIANKVANHLGIFSSVFSSTKQMNLSGSNKRDMIKGHMANFAYAGNASVDLPIWLESSEIIAANVRQSVLNRAKKINGEVLTFGIKKFRPLIILKSIRVYQWVKNLLVFLPLMLSHQIFDWDLLSSSILAFMSFCFCSSSAYLVNDLMDLEADRKHPEKCRRPFASGELSLFYGIIGAPILLVLGLTLSASLSLKLCALLATYYLLTLCYSFFLKSLLLIDVVVLSVLYFIRIGAGSVSTSIKLSAWMAVFSVFLFFTLALVKRISELKILEQQNQDKTPGRSYLVSDLNYLVNMGISSGYIAVLVLALYINSNHVNTLYQSPNLLWPICVMLLYWISYLWMQVQRGKMCSDPIIFTLRDPRSYLILFLSVLCAVSAKIFDI